MWWSNNIALENAIISTIYMYTERGVSCHGLPRSSLNTLGAQHVPNVGRFSLVQRTTDISIAIPCNMMLPMQWIWMCLVGTNMIILVVACNITMVYVPVGTILDVSIQIVYLIILAAGN